jgi:hypothetical protein
MQYIKTQIENHKVLNENKIYVPQGNITLSTPPPPPLIALKSSYTTVIQISFCVKARPIYSTLNLPNMF